MELSTTRVEYSPLEHRDRNIDNRYLYREIPRKHKIHNFFALSFARFTTNLQKLPQDLTIIEKD